MGTKTGGKRHSGEVDEGTRSSDAGKKGGKKKMRRWLPKMFRSKRKYRSLSEECLHDASPSAATATEPERDADVGMVVEESHEYGYRREVSIEENAENVIENVQKDESPDEEEIGTAEAETRNRGKDENINGGKKASLGSALRMIKESFRSKKRRKHSTDYTKFSEAKSTDDLTTPANATTPSFSGTNTTPNTTDKTDSNIPAKNSAASGKTRNKSAKYVRFTANDCDGDDENNKNKENITMTIGEKDVEDVTSTTRKKKKSARKRAAKAGRTTGRVLGEGMLQMGKNLQYLSPIPTQHVFSSSSSSRSGNTRPPKKRSYKYTASAPTTNPYAFI